MKNKIILCLTLMLAPLTCFSAENRIQDDLADLHNWLAINASPLDEKLNPPAEKSEIDDIEKRLGIIFPTSVRKAYLVHNGENEKTDGIFGTLEWLSLERIVEEYDVLNENNGKVKRIPLLLSGGGDYLYVESVKNSGLDSEVMEWWHEVPTRDVKFRNFSVYIHKFVVDLKDDKYVYLPEILNGLIDKSEL